MPTSNLSSGALSNSQTPSQVATNVGTSAKNVATAAAASIKSLLVLDNHPPGANSGGHQKKSSQSSMIIQNAAGSAVVASMSQTNIDTANDDQLHIEDIEIMKQRSANNSTFLCIKIPEIELLVTYRGSNREQKKNIKDLNEVSLLFPLFEVHDKTWTWLDLINALKSHVKKALVSQVHRSPPHEPIQHGLLRFQIKRRSNTN